MTENNKFRLEVLNSISFQDDLTILEQGKGKKFVSRFIEPGIVSYSQFGDVLIKKETIDKFLDSIIGCPVIIKHKDITPENADKERVGVVSNAWYNEQDGWYYCDGIIFDKQAIDLVKNQGWSVSCTYDFESDKKPLVYNGKELAMEFTDGDFLHLALVPNPRYNDANIVINSKEKNDDIEWITVKGNHIPIKKGQSKDEAVKEWIEKWEDKDKDELVTVEKADEETIKKYKETNDRWQKAIKETAKKEGWDKEDKSDTKDKQTDSKGEKKVSYKSTFEDIRNLVGSIKKGEQFFDSKIRTAEKKLQDKLEFAEKDIKDARWDNMPSVKKSKERIIEKIKDELKEIKELKNNKASNALLNGLETILDNFTPDKADLPVLNGLKDILEQ